ncbi:MAG: hypothetical protein P8170_24380 [Gemmatimonadota bacterium]|jgi:hypothetical protein
MRPIVNDLLRVRRQELRWSYLLSVGVLLAALIAVNYGGSAEGLRWKAWLNQEYRGSELLMLLYVPFYGVPYLLSLVAFAHFHKRWEIFRDRELWIRIAFLLLVLGFDSGFYYFDNLGASQLPPADRWFFARTAGKFSSVVAIFLPLLIFRWWRDRDLPSLYGLTPRGFHPRPYLLLLAAMVPLILAATFLDDFMRAYPRIGLARVDGLSSLSRGEALMLFEVAYAFDFVWTELLFRGFMVLGFERQLGAGSLLPMVTVYCMRHFNKPLGESISSILGGFVLGVIAWRSRSILGGLLLHVGVALLMEALAFARVFGLW